MLKEFPFYNVLIEKPNIKNLNDVEMLSELPFYDELNIVKTATSKIIKDKHGNMNDPLVQLEASKPVIKDLSGDLLIEMKGFKYQITLKVSSSKQKKNGDTEFSTVFFNSAAKTVINLNKCGPNLSKTFI